jgi:hypothetical protein
MEILEILNLCCMDAIKFINEVDGLESVCLDEIRGGLALASYSEGCNSNDHQQVKSNAATIEVF